MNSNTVSTMNIDAHSVHQFKPLDKNGNEFDMANLKGKYVLIVNLATKCYFAVQVKEFGELYEQFKDKGVTLIGFPCNQFWRQCPEDACEVEDAFCSDYNAKFPVMNKINVNGKDAAPIYKFLKKEKKWFGVGRVKWNFEKFLCDPDGHVIKRWSSTTNPKVIKEFLERCSSEAPAS